MRAQNHKSLQRERKRNYFSLALLVLTGGILVSWYLDPNFWSDANLSKLGKKIIGNVVRKIVKNNRNNRTPKSKNKDTLSDKDSKLIMTFKSIEAFETAKKKREGGGFMVRRPVGDKIETVNPFLMLDHLGPTVYGPGEALGAPDHPHRGFETVTYVIDGKFKLLQKVIVYNYLLRISSKA